MLAELTIQRDGIEKRFARFECFSDASVDEMKNSFWQYGATRNEKREVAFEDIDDVVFWFMTTESNMYNYFTQSAIARMRCAEKTRLDNGQPSLYPSWAVWLEEKIAEEHAEDEIRPLAEKEAADLMEKLKFVTDIKPKRVHLESHNVLDISAENPDSDFTVTSKFKPDFSTYE